MRGSKPNSLSPSSITVAPATAERWLDVNALFTRHGERGCWCQYWRESSSTYSHNEPGSGKANLRLQIKEGPTPGMIAYVDGVPAGWLGFWPRERLERIVRSRTIPKIDDNPVWAIVCFMVRTGYRRKGVAAALLNGAIAHAQRSGVPALEAYPIDNDGARMDATQSYVGFRAMFESAGFHTVVETDARSANRTRIVMRLDLQNQHRV